MRNSLWFGLVLYIFVRPIHPYKKMHLKMSSAKLAAVLSRPQCVEIRHKMCSFWVILGCNFRRMCDVRKLSQARDHFTYDFFNVMEIRLIFPFALIKTLIDCYEKSHTTHDSRAVVACAKFVEICWQGIELQQNTCLIDFEFRRGNFTDFVKIFVTCPNFCSDHL